MERSIICGLEVYMIFRDRTGLFRKSLTFIWKIVKELCYAFVSEMDREVLGWKKVR